MVAKQHLVHIHVPEDRRKALPEPHKFGIIPNESSKLTGINLFQEGSKGLSGISVSPLKTELYGKPRYKEHLGPLPAHPEFATYRTVLLWLK